jgi:hypothetical protein
MPNIPLSYNLLALLAPLTSPADLPNHPSMSVAYTSKHLTQLAEEAGAISRKEQIMLSKAKLLCTKLQGDVSWVPSALEAPGQSFSCRSKSSYPRLTQIQGTPMLHPWKDGITLQERNPSSIKTPSTSPKQATQQDVPMQDEPQLQEIRDTTLEPGKDHPSAVNGPVSQTNGDSNKQPGVNGVPASNSTSPQEVPEAAVNGISHKENGEGGSSKDDDVAMQSPLAEDVSETASQHTAHRMTTRAQANAISKTPSPPPSPSSVLNPIHPLFTFPTEFLPDRDFGLPAMEAEETRMLLLALVQKQEEIARAASDLSLGMMQGDRMRGDVFKWAKAEGHVGEMSDGEDWYDKEEWGLDQDLAKGRDEEEEENQVQGKKTTRRQGRRTDKEDR